MQKSGSGISAAACINDALGLSVRNVAEHERTTAKRKIGQAF